MTKQSSPKVITANHLLDGDVIYIGQNDAWVRDLDDAVVFTDPDLAEEKLAYASAQIETVVGVYLMDVAIIDEEPTPTHFREVFRATGPSNYAHGRQEQSHV